MTFGRAGVLVWLALAIALLAFGAWAAARAGARRRALLGGQADVLAPRFAVARRVLRDALLAAGVAACVLALAAPKVGTWVRPVQERGVDLMIVLDTSRSMLARDLSPTRLERAKREIRGLLDRLHGDRIGLVTFAGDARIVCPLTADPASFRLFLDDVDMATNARGGTAVGEGLELALDSFDPSFPSARVIVLLTDGEDNASDPPASEVAYRAHALGIPVHVVAFGTAEGSEIAIDDEHGNSDVVRTAEGEPVISVPDEALLEQVAHIGDGAYLSAERTAFPLDEIWDKRIALMEGVTRNTASRTEGIDRFQWALVLALVLLGTRALLPDGRAR